MHQYGDVASRAKRRSSPKAENQGPLSSDYRGNVKKKERSYDWVWIVRKAVKALRLCGESAAYLK